MAFEAPRDARKAERQNRETDLQKRAFLGKLAEGAVVELHGESAGKSASEGEIFSQHHVAESIVRHEAQIFMHDRQAEVEAERKKLEAKQAKSKEPEHTTRAAEAAADAMLLEQTRTELASSPLNTVAEAGLETAKTRTEELIDKALGVEAPQAQPKEVPGLEGAISPSAESYWAMSPEDRAHNLHTQITYNENHIRERTAGQFEQVKQPKQALEALQSKSSEYADLVPLYRQELGGGELTAIANNIIFEGMTAAQLFEMHQFDEAALRRIVAEFIAGGDTDASIRAEKANHEGRYERDPRLRHRKDSRQLAPATSRMQIDADEDTIQSLGQTAAELHDAPPDATSMHKNSPLPDLSQLDIKKAFDLKPQQVITVIAVALFMIAIIFLALALTR